MRTRHGFGKFLRSRGLTGLGIVVGQPAVGRQVLGGWQGSCVTEMAPGAGSDAIRGRDQFDFIYLAGEVEGPAVRKRLAELYPRVRPRGVLAGEGYIDGRFGGRDYGVKSAVDELARAEGLQVRVTFDDLPAWFAVKEDRRTAPPRRMAVLTAHDQKHEPLAAVSSPNKAAYCARHGYDFLQRTSGFEPSRPLAWSKIRFLREALDGYEWVLWSDADSLVMEPAVRLEEFADDEADVVLCHEDFGVGVYNVNTGQMLVKNSPWAKAFLDEVWGQTRFVHDRLWEQRAVIHLLWQRDLSRHVHLVTQRRFNSYPCNYRSGDFMLHFADMPDEVREKAMRQWAQFG